MSYIYNIKVFLSCRFYACLTKIAKQMLKEKAGVIAGTIWNALNETEGMTAKQLKKATK